MMKNEFLARLKELLADLPQEEREEAVRYYEDYFADAGPLEEARVLQELVSPEDVAEKIRTGCVGAEKNDGADLFSENAFENGARESARAQEQGAEPKAPSGQSQSMGQGSPRAQDQGMGPEAPSGQNQSMEQGNPWMQDQGVEPEAPSGQNQSTGQETPWAQQDSGFTDAREQEEWMRMDETYAQDYGEGGRQARRQRYSHAQGYGGDGDPRGAVVRTKSYFSPVIFVLALLFGIPVLCPILIAFICVMGGFFIGFGIGGVGLVAGGVALVGSALANASAGMGLLFLFSGGGLILTAIGIFFIVFAVNCAFRAIPALFRGIRRVVLALRGRIA